MNEINRKYERKKEKQIIVTISATNQRTQLAKVAALAAKMTAKTYSIIKMKSNRNYIPYIIIRYPMKQCAASHECVEIIRKPHGSPPPSTVPRMYYTA